MNGLDPFRRRLDVLDEQIAGLLGERFEICREIALYKHAHEIPMMQPGRVAEVRARYLARGAEVDLPPDFTAGLFELLIGATCRMEDELMGAPSAAGTPADVGRSAVGTPGDLGRSAVGTPGAMGSHSRAPEGRRA
jgi:4-amino-4-deoxychorismate mutase